MPVVEGEGEYARNSRVHVAKVFGPRGLLDFVTLGFTHRDATAIWLSMGIYAELAYPVGKLVRHVLLVVVLLTHDRRYMRRVKALLAQLQEVPVRPDGRWGVAAAEVLGRLACTLRAHPFSPRVMDSFAFDPRPGARGPPPENFVRTVLDGNSRWAWSRWEEILPLPGPPWNGAVSPPSPEAIQIYLGVEDPCNWSHALRQCYFKRDSTWFLVMSGHVSPRSAPLPFWTLTQDPCTPEPASYVDVLTVGMDRANWSHYKDPAFIDLIDRMFRPRH